MYPLAKVLAKVRKILFMPYDLGIYDCYALANVSRVASPTALVMVLIQLQMRFGPERFPVHVRAVLLKSGQVGLSN